MSLTLSASMRTYVPAILLLAFVVPALAQSHQREKIAEGEFQIVPAEQLTNPKQSWVLWREMDGKFHVEDHFSFFEDPSLMALAYLGNLSRELQREVADKVGQTQLDVTFSSDWKPESLVLRGVRVADGGTVELAKCKVDDREVSCKGLHHGAKLKKVGSEELLFSFPFPLLVRHLALRAKQDPRHNATATLVELRVEKDSSLKLLPCEATAAFVGEEVLSTVSVGSTPENIPLTAKLQRAPLALSCGSQETTLSSPPKIKILTS